MGGRVGSMGNCTDHVLSHAEHRHLTSESESSPRSLIQNNPEEGNKSKDVVSNATEVEIATEVGDGGAKSTKCNGQDALTTRRPLGRPKKDE